MRRRKVEPTPKPDVKKRRVSFAGKVAVRIAAVAGVTALAALVAAWGFLFAVFCGPSHAARDELTAALSENSLTSFIPRLYLPDSTVEEILSQQEE